MAPLERLQRAWYEGGRVPLWAWPLTGLYAAATALRRGLYRVGLKRSVRLACPVVVIGNLTAGGTGKTPLTIALAAALRERGFRPGVVSRGHGGSNRAPRLLDAAPDPAVVGDEPCLIRASGVPVAVGRDRPAAAGLLLDAGCDVILADDGLQHYRLGRDLELCVIDGARRFGNRHLLPAGPLREPLRRLAAVDFRIVNGGEAGPGEVPMRLAGGAPVRVDGGGLGRLADWAGRRVHAVAAIGNPARFFASLRAAGIEPVEHAFPDHHAFRPEDLAFGDGLPLLMTDKDAVKCRAFARPDWWRMPVSAVLPAAFLDTLAADLRFRQRH